MLIDSLRNFVEKLCQVIESNPTEKMILTEVKDLMGDLVCTDDWLPVHYSIAHSDYYQQYLLYCDGLERFSIVSFVWGPGQ